MKCVGTGGTHKKEGFMEQGIIQAHSRHTSRSMRNAIQGSPIKALVEIITNSDDSYSIIEQQGGTADGRIEISYKALDDNSLLFTIRDYARGMSIDTVRSSYKKYGAATSGMEDGAAVRGYFGQGAKDALAAMKDGQMHTFHNDEYVECHIYIEDDKPHYKIMGSFQDNELMSNGAAKANSKLRKKFGVSENGTVSIFRYDQNHNPRYDTIREGLSNNYILRKIMSNPKRKVTLTYENQSKTRQCRYKIDSKKAVEILSDTFILPYPGFNDLTVTMVLKKAECELEQVGDDRTGGLLILDDKNAVLDISLFKFDREPLASHFYGEIVINGFRDLLIKGEAVLSEERNGLVRRHPFCQAFIEEVEKRLDEKIQEEKANQKKQEVKIGREEAGRYRKCFSILNDIAEEISNEINNIGTSMMDEPVSPKDGLCFSPAIINASVGKMYKAHLILDTKIVHHGSMITLSCTNPLINIAPASIYLDNDSGKGIIRKWVSIDSDKVGQSGILTAVTTEGVRAEAQISIVPEPSHIEELKAYGVVFQPANIHANPGQARTAELWVYTKRVPDGSKIFISSDNKDVEISLKEIIFNHNDAVKNVAKYPIEITGYGEGTSAFVSAHVEDCVEMETGICVTISTSETKNKKFRGGIFSEPEFVGELDPNDDVVYSRDSGKVRIYTNFPSTKFYIGEDSCNKKTLAGRIKIAELIAKSCFHELARKKVDESGMISISNPVARLEKIERESLQFAKKSGKKVLEVLIGALEEYEDEE